MPPKKSSYFVPLMYILLQISLIKTNHWKSYIWWPFRKFDYIWTHWETLWNLSQNYKLSFQVNVFQNVVCQITTSLFQPECVKADELPCLLILFLLWTSLTQRGIVADGPYLTRMAINQSGPWFNIKTSVYQYRKSHCGDKTVVRSSYLHNEISCISKMVSFLLNQGPGS